MKRALHSLSLAVVLSSASTLAAADTKPEITVYKSPTCSCCIDWAKHMEASGFSVKRIDTKRINTIKADAGLTPDLASCHTAFIDGYVIEGHVPADDVKRLLAESPDTLGLSVPGMPIGSPGMEMGDRHDYYQVLMFNDRGQSRVFAEHN
ncbi:DUF411 domain-containing protein [Nitrococcus mobilis]|nr:DUF411 domain-containing protein [Nitrococcus mobilis]